MSAYVIADIRVHDAESYRQYVAQVPALIAKHGGSYVVRGGEPSLQEGDWQADRIVILRFPDRAHIRAFIEDPAYAPVVAIRHAAATTQMVIVDGCEPNR